MLVRFRASPSKAELLDFAFRYRLEVGRHIGQRWFRMRMQIDMHPAYMATVLKKDRLVCDALPIAVAPVGSLPPSPVEPCAAPSTGTRKLLSWSAIRESFDSYPWFVDVVSDGANYAGGMFSYRFYSDGSFEAVATPMFQ